MFVDVRKTKMSDEEKEAALHDIKHFEKFVNNNGKSHNHCQLLIFLLIVCVIRCIVNVLKICVITCILKLNVVNFFAVFKRYSFNQMLFWFCSSVLEKKFCKLRNSFRESQRNARVTQQNIILSTEQFTTQFINYINVNIFQILNFN